MLFDQLDDGEELDAHALEDDNAVVLALLGMCSLRSRLTEEIDALAPSTDDAATPPRAADPPIPRTLLR